MSELLTNLFNVIRHCFQKSPERFLIARWDSAVLLNNLSLFSCEALDLLNPREYVNRIDAKGGNSCEISCVGVSSAPLVASLRITIHSTRLG